MESSKAFDVPRVLTPESDTRLLRVFHFLRQPGRRAKAAAAAAATAMAARKKAEILERTQEQTSGPAAVPRERDETATIAECSNQQDLVAVELDRLLQDAAATENRAQMIVVRQDLGQLPRLSDHDTSGAISAADLSAALKAMDRPTPKASRANDPTVAEIQWMIWELDDDQDGCLDWHEFRSCYARALVDKHGLEPNMLFHVITFLLCDPTHSASVSVADLREELAKVPGTQHLLHRLRRIARKEEQDAEQQLLLHKISLAAYLELMFADVPSSFNVTKFDNL